MWANTSSINVSRTCKAGQIRGSEGGGPFVESPSTAIWTRMKQWRKYKKPFFGRSDTVHLTNGALYYAPFVPFIIETFSTGSGKKIFKWKNIEKLMGPKGFEPMTARL